MFSKPHKHYPVPMILVIVLIFLRIGEYLIGHFFGNRDGIIANQFLTQGLFYLYLPLIFILILFLGKSMADNPRVETGMGRVFYYLIVVFFSVCLVEIISRKLFPSRPPFEQRFPVHQWRYPKPYTMFSGKPGAHGLNSLGYVGQVPRMPKPEHEYRIFFLGASTLVEGNPPIPEIVQNLFKHNSFTDVKTYNWGVVSSVSGMELARLVYEITELSPDLVIMYNGANDITLPFNWDPRPGYPFNFIAYEFHPLVDKDVKAYPGTALFLYGSNIMRLFFRNYFVDKFVPLERVRNECFYLSDDWKDSIVDTYIQNMVKADKASKAFDAGFMAIYQPLIYFKDTSALCDKEREILAEQNFLKEGVYAREMRERVVLGIKQAIAVHGVDVVDASLIYEKDTSWVFTDNVHTTQEAKRIMASAIFGHITERIGERITRKKSAGSGL